MRMCKLGATGLEIAPLVLGGNVFGWTADRERSFAVLDAFVEAGFNAIDTADVYNRYAPGMVGGESETIIGEWMRARGNRERVVIITKGGLAMGEGMQGLGAAYLPQACEASLRRLGTDYIDVYLAHAPDPATPIAETVESFAQLIARGLIRHTGCSNYSTAQLREALTAGAGSAGRFAVAQPLYNLVQRDAYEGEMEKLCAAEGLGVVTYYALAAGFLTGKYRSEADLAGKPRSGVVAKFLNPDGLAVVERLDAVAARHATTPAQVALAWNMARASVTAPIASATGIDQLTEIIGAARLDLTADDIAMLDARS